MEKSCSVCGKSVRVIIYSDKSYRGGHYFGKIPEYTDKAWAKAMRAGTHKETVCGKAIDVMNEDPIPHSFFEYWECPGCYWGGK